MKKIIGIGCILSLYFLFGCGKNDVNSEVEEKEVMGYNVKTYYGEEKNVSVIIATDGKDTIVAIPKLKMSFKKDMSDSLIKCLKDCRNDPSHLNCILKCPSSFSFRIFAR
jgi:hypothetical protein